MPTPDQIRIHEDLLRLKTSDALEHVSMSQLARQGTAVLRRIHETAQAVTVSIQGKDAMVTVPRRQYDEMVTLIQRIQSAEYEDGFDQVLAQKFDCLVAEMNRPGMAETVTDALFSDPADLNRNYRPGITETGK